jgi:RHS repeat-associated protein
MYVVHTNDRKGDMHFLNLVFLDNEYRDIGVRLVDINGDNLPDLVRSNGGNLQSHPQGYPANAAYINNGTTFVQDDSWIPPVPTLSYASGFCDKGTRLVDVNNDGLVDLISSSSVYPNSSSIYLNNGHGWSYFASTDSNYSLFPLVFSNAYCQDDTVRFNDLNGDSMVDISRSKRVNVYPGGGTMITSNSYLNDVSKIDTQGSEQWKQNSSYELPIPFVDDSLQDRGGRIIDVNGDGIQDMVSGDYFYGLFTKLADSKIPDLLSTITLETGGTISVKYQASTQYKDAQEKLLNPKLPMVVQTVESITESDPFTGVSGETKYVYEGGHYYFNGVADRKFAGFEKVTTIRPDQSKIVTYYHQGNGSNSSFAELKDHVSKIGMPYRQEIIDKTGKLFSRVSSKYQSAELPSTNNDRSFVYKNQEISEELDGNATSVATAQSSVYDETNGNLLKTTEYGDVSVPAPNAFQDLGNDQRVTQLSYATNQMGQYEISQQVKYGGLNSEMLLGKEKYYYDQLPFGELGNGLLTKKVRWIDEQNIQEETFSYDVTGFLLTSTDPLGKMTTSTPDPYKLYPETVTNALNQTLKYTYNYGIGAVASSTDYQNNITSYSYDGFGRPTAIHFKDVVANQTYPLETSSYQDTYDVPNKKLVASSVTKHLQSNQTHTSTTFFDGLGRTIRTQQENDDGSGCLITDQSYDVVGNIAKNTLPYEGTCGTTYEGFQAAANLQTSFSYDVLGRPISQTNVLGKTTWEYDDRKTTITDPLSKKKMLTTDALGRLTKVTESLENNTYDTQYSYDLNDHLISMVDASQNVRKFTYDLLGNRLSATDLHAVNDGLYGIWRETYEKGMRKSSTEKPGGQMIEYTYDDLHRLKTKTSGGVTLETYTYDTCKNGIGKVCKVETLQTTENYSYDVLGRLKQETLTTNQKTFTSSYTYDLAGHVLSEKHPNIETTTWTYTNRGLPKTITHQGAPVIQHVTYNVLGQPQTIEYANGKTTTYSYDSAKLFQLSHLRTPGLQDTGYTFDAAGNLLTETETSTNNPYTLTYGYDDLSRLTTAALTINGITKERKYSYDIVGNMLSSPAGAYLHEGSTSTQEGLKYANPHAVTAIQGQPIFYTPEGNVKTVGTTNYLYDYKEALIQVQSNQQTVANYVSVPSGRRVAKYLKAQSNEPNGGAYYTPTKEFEVDGAGLNTIRFFLGNQEVASQEKPQNGGATYRYVHPDHLGGTRVITDQQGNEVQTLYYHPFGEIRLNHQAGSFDEQRKFTGHLHDDETDLEFMEARYYNATWGRFLRQDPVFLELGSNPDLSKLLVDPQQLNAYAYARNNPLKYVDPTGMYNVKTGKIEKGDTKESITNEVNKAFGIKTTWKDIAEVSFFKTRYGTTDPSKLVGRSTNTGTDDVVEVTEDIDLLLGMMSVKLKAYQDCGMWCSIDYAVFFRNNGPFDLINRQRNDYLSHLFGGNPSKRTHWAYIYNGKLIRYDAPGNIVAGYGASFFGLNQELLHNGADLEATARSVGKTIEKRNWGYFQGSDDPVDAKYLDKGYCLYYKANNC